MDAVGRGGNLMLLVSVKVGPFKSINEPQEVRIDGEVTVLVGMNEAGKTVFLQVLEKSNDAVGVAQFDPVDDYPRKDLPGYLKVHKTKPARATELTYQLSDGEVAAVNKALHTQIPAGFTFSVSHSYDNKATSGLAVDERPAVAALVAQSKLSSDASNAFAAVASIRSIPETLKGVSLTEEDKAFLGAVEARSAKAKWDSVVQWEVWEYLSPLIPKFLYFGEYDLLASKMNLADLAQWVEQAKADPKQLRPEHRAVLALLRMADISVADFAKPGGYEPLKAKIEGVSINLTDRILEFWKQNEDLEVEVDIKPDPEDEAPFNNGPNLYLRIRNRRHRGVSTPFRQRSRGFIWFSSFLVWFDDVRQQLVAGREAPDRDLILLLDEPGLSLHALAQADFLRYIDSLAEKHQVLFTTHSPFMVPSDKLFRVRVVEDRDKVGTVVSDNISSSDPRTVFPLQAALGWTLAQNLFISERNLLVEGPSDLIYLKAATAVLEAQGLSGLRDDVTVVPVGGLDKVATFVALLGASGLKLGVLYDYRGTPEQKLLDLVKQKIIAPKLILNAAQFRDLAALGTASRATDTEDLFRVDLYVDYFNRTYAKALGGVRITEAGLPPGDRIIDRLERFLSARGIQLRPSGGFNHYAIAVTFASDPPNSLHADTVRRFEALFAAVNGLF